MPPFSFAALSRRFLAHARLHLRPNSIRIYRESLQRMERSLADGVRAAHLRSEDIDRFVASELARGQSRESINTRLRSLKACLHWGVRERLLADVPVHVRLLRVTRTRGERAFDRDDVARLLALAAPRERALLALLAAGGLRIEEALHLRWGDLDGDRLRISAKPEVDWTPKSHAEREVYLPEGALRELAAYRATLRWNRAENWLFQSRVRGRRLTTASGVVRELFRAARVYRRGRLFHELRRGAASAWMLQGVDLRTIQDLLGHASVTTTERYLRVNEAAKRAAAAKGLV